MDTEPAEKKRRVSDDQEDPFNHITKTLGRLSLKDSGERDWYEESVKYLDLHFEDWKDLKRTVMIPSAFKVPLQDASRGDITEKKVYDLLEEFGNAYAEPMFVVHSHNFADLIDEKKKGFEGTKRWNKGEHDFVIIHRRYGFIFLQVKSSAKTGKASKDAKWQLGKDFKSIKNFLLQCFENNPSSTVLEGVLHNYPCFIVMPNCQPTQPEDAIVFKSDCENKESFKRWWDKKVATSNNRVMSEELYKALLIRFVALRCTSPTTSSQIDETHSQIVHFHTPEQLKCMLTAGTVQWWAGPAGSGKTVLLKRKVKELAQEILKQKTSEKILVLCFNKPLSVHLRINFLDWFAERFPKSPANQVEVYTYDLFVKNIFLNILKMEDKPESYPGEKFANRRRDVENHFKTHDLYDSQFKYQHIFVDEGQDFSGEDWITLLEKFHDRTGDYRRYFWVFFDSNQHVQYRKNESISWLSDPNVFHLTKVLRNTENIFLLAKTCYSGANEHEISLGHKEVGMNVVYDDTLIRDRSNGVQILVKHIRELQREKVKLLNVVILGKNRDAANHLMENLERVDPPIPCNDAEYPEVPRYTLEDFIVDFVIVDSIRRFKGLESKVVILYDPPYVLDDADIMALLYTAISRCFCYLVVVSTKGGCKAIKERVDKIKYREKDKPDGGVRNKDWD